MLAAWLITGLAGIGNWQHSVRRTHGKRIARPNQEHKQPNDHERMTDIAVHDRFRFESRPNAALAARAAGVPVLDVVVPVYNEQVALAIRSAGCTATCAENFRLSVRITIADNASIDATPRIAAELAIELDEVRVVTSREKGRGRALHSVVARTHRCWPTWTSTCRPIWPRWRPSSRR